MSALVEVRDLAGGYRPGDDAIHDVGFGVEPGRLVAVLGPNGGGKTTLFRALLGTLPVRRGDVRVQGRPAYVPQTEGARLDFPASARDVVLMGAYGRTPWYRRIGATDRGRARDALARVGLADRAGAHYGSLSGGQRQRVLIARALLEDAAVLLLDEPLSGVDAVSGAAIEALFAELRGEGRALLVATHDVALARDYDEVLCLNRGQVAYGPPAETLTPETLQRTYGGELVMVGDRAAIRLDHHGHGHAH
jgi:manganese/iron transport system ATP-binding protein/manganese/zinc/iron transport system ATP- binding protein